MTPHEVIAWSVLRSWRDAGFHIRRQVPMGPYMADFVCHGARLVIEIDGGGHAERSQERADRERDAWFAARGYHTVRIWNIDLGRDREAALEPVWFHLQERTQSRRPLK